MAEDQTRRGLIERDRDRRFGEVFPLPTTRLATDERVPEQRDLGPLQQLLGVWTAQGTGWNMIALPFDQAPSGPIAGHKFRILMNQYDEDLRFTFVDDKVPNRGLVRPDTPGEASDQLVVTVDYQQKVRQIDAEDLPTSVPLAPPDGLGGPDNLPIHHEPGLWLYERNRRTKDDRIKGDDVTLEELTVARLASIPHGNSVLAIGTSSVQDGMPDIPMLSGLPSGRFEDIKTNDYDFKTDPYLAPYLHYIDHPYMGKVADASFPGFSPADMNEILRFANKDLGIARTTTLTVDSTRKSGGISNVPFSLREAEPVSMRSTFWIQELEDTDEFGNPKLRLQYSQVVMLNFFRPREDEFPERAAWPHISIATLNKEPAEYRLESS